MEQGNVNIGFRYESFKLSFEAKSGERAMVRIGLAMIIFVSFAFSIVAQQKYTIQQYLSIRSATSPSLSPDGKRLVFLTNVSGTSQVWMIDLPSGVNLESANLKPRQLTDYEDNVSFVRFSPTGSGIVFGKSRGGDENTQLFWMSPDGSEIKQLTNDPKIRHNFGGWSEDGTKIFYASNKRNRNFFDIYSMDIATGKEELIYQNDGSNSFSAISPDGSKLIVSRASERFSLDNDLYLIDLKTGKTTHLTPHDEATIYSDVHFLADGKRILLGTNQNREFINLAFMSLDEERIKETKLPAITFLDNTKWDLGVSELSPDRTLLAYTINREGFSELYLRKIEKNGSLSRNFEVIKLPAQGIVGSLSFTKDKIALTFSSAKYNTDIWIYDLKAKKLARVTKSDLAGISQDSFVEPRLIKYKTFDNLEIPAWYYVPKESVAEKLPVIVSVHGGPESQERPGFNALYQYFLSRGYAILAPNVRGSTGYGKTYASLDNIRLRENAVKDLAYAVEWLKSFGNADPKRIAVMGGSYGGYMTMAAITLYPDLWAAAVNTVGIVNWETFLKNTSGYRRRQREVEYGFLDKDLEFLRQISPISRVDRIKTPLFVIHGKNDPRVPYTEAEQIVKALRERGAIVEYKLFEDEGHGVSKLKNRLELYPLVADFLDRYMKKP
ncbi:MAG: S9 family peptidase [Acidobacteria bacterium]|nr:MAG: S9 family peptidase [Acidobacteriota bacterium]